MTAYSTQVYASKWPANSGHGNYNQSSHLHAISGSISTWAANDTINVGMLPRGAVVVSCSMKAASQLDSNGTPTLTLDLGIVGTPQLFKAAISTVGRASGTTADQTIAAVGVLYKNTSGADVTVLATVHAGAATPVAGTLEFDVEFYVEDATGSNP